MPPWGHHCWSATAPWPTSSPAMPGQSVRTLVAIRRRLASNTVEKAAKLFLQECEQYRRRGVPKAFHAGQAAYPGVVGRGAHGAQQSPTSPRQPSRGAHGAQQPPTTPAGPPQPHHRRHRFAPQRRQVTPPLRGKTCCAGTLSTKTELCRGGLLNSRSRPKLKPLGRHLP